MKPVNKLYMKKLISKVENNIFILKKTLPNVIYRPKQQYKKWLSFLEKRNLICL